MKKLFKVALVAICMLFMGNFAKAQTKVAFINMNDLIGIMPEFKTIQTQIQSYQKTFVDQLTGLQTEIQTKGKDYETKRATMADATRTVKESELTDLQKRYQDLQASAQQQVEAKGQEYMKPLIDKTTAAVTAVAKEKGYAYVLDSGSVQMIVKPEADDLMAAVKLKLALK